MLGFFKEKLKKLKEKIVGKPGEKAGKEEEETVKGEKKKAGREVERPEVERGVERRKKKRKSVVKEHKEKEKLEKGEIEEETKKKPERKKEGLLKKVKRALVRKFKLSPDELDEYLWDLELILLEGDVAHEVAESLISELREELAGMEFSSRDDVFDVIRDKLKEKIRRMFKEPFDLIKSDRHPTVVMFIGPNGAGKTTTMAKLAKLAMDQGKTVIFAASDTFRAASIEQLEEHARRLGVRVIKHRYGADPAAVAYDAVNSAKANNVDFVFIDTAGRQETNRNLIEELKKIKRVVNPDYIIYVDEALAGNVILDRLRNFGELGISGVILTKMDLDVKGGGAITAASFGIPIIYIGKGQSYDDLEIFDLERFLEALLGD